MASRSSLPEAPVDTDMPAEGAPLSPSSEPVCRNCGRPTIRGFLQGESARPLTPATILWVDDDGVDSYRLADVGIFAWSKSPRVPAIQCESCGLIEIPPDREREPDASPSDEESTSGDPPG